LLASSASAATLIGQPGTGAYYLPDVDTIYPAQTAVPPAFVIGAGEEQDVTIEGVTTFNVDFDAATLAVLFDTSLPNPTFDPTAFNGLIFNSPGFTTLASATVNPLTTLGAFDNSRVTLVGDELRLNFSGLSYQTGDLVRLDFTSTNGGVIPEPGAWAMMILGFGGVGAMMRRRRTLAAPA
jgi:hypothetical protein